MCKPRRIFSSDFEGASSAFAGASSGFVAPLRGGKPNAAAVSHGSGFGADSSSSADGSSLNGMRDRAASAASEVTFGTDGPPEAGTLSLADASVPFGESLKAIRFGAAEVEVGAGEAAGILKGTGDLAPGASIAGSGSALAIASAVAGSKSTLTGGNSVVSNSSIEVPNFSLSSSATFRNGVSTCGDAL